MKKLRLPLMILGLAALLSSAACAYVYPTVTFNWDQSADAYIYTITVSPLDSFPLGYVELDTWVKKAAWTALGPVVDGSEIGWTKSWFEWTDFNGGCDAATWFATSYDQEIHPGNANWVGVFTLIAPNTRPADGFGLTMDGSENSANPFTVYVPGPVPIVPEPSSLLALGSGLTAGLGLWLRTRTRA